MDPFNPTERPADPRGGFTGSPEGCIAGTAWGGELSLNGGTPEGPRYEGHTTGSVSPINPPA